MEGHGLRRAAHFVVQDGFAQFVGDGVFAGVVCGRVGYVDEGVEIVGSVFCGDLHQLLALDGGVVVRFIDVEFDDVVDDGRGDSRSVTFFCFHHDDESSLHQFSRGGIGVIGTSGSLHVVGADGEGDDGIDDYGDLYKIDMNSGNETLVGATGVVPGNYYQSATFDQTTGKLWWAARTEGERSVLYEVNTSTGEATQKAVFPWDERFLALYIPDSLGIDSTKIGLDKPAAPTKATLDGNAEEIVLKWNASKGALHKDGKISDKGLTYHVTLHYGDGALNFDAQDTTKVFAIDDLDIAELTKCYFEVVTMNDSVASDTTTSNSFAAGQVLEVPYNNEFKSSEDFDQLTILDNNGDGRTWQFVEDYNTVIYKYADEDADDWILTPMLNLKGGQKYIFKFQASPQGSEYPETLNAAFGKTIDVESYTTILEKAVVATKDSVFEVTFTPDTIIT